MQAQNLILLDESRFGDEIMQKVRPALEVCAEPFSCEIAPGQALNCCLYRVKDSGRCVVLSHGFTEFHVKFEEMTYYFLNQGFSVAVYDQRGHGYSFAETKKPEVIHVRHFDDYVSDLNTVLAAVKRMLPPDTEYILYGHSMGGAIAARYLEKYPGDFQRCILNAPMLAIRSDPMPPWLSKLAALFFMTFGMAQRGFFVQKPFDADAPFADSYCTSRPRFDFYQAVRAAVPQYQRNLASYRWIWEGLDNTDRFFRKKNLAAIRIPILMFGAELESLVRNDAQEKLAAALPNVTYKVIPGVKHEIYRSPNAVLEGYYGDIFDFLNK